MMNSQKREIAGDVLERMLNAGLSAPSSNHQRQWEPFTLTDKAAIRALAKLVRPYHEEIKKSAKKGGQAYA